MEEQPTNGAFHKIFDEGIENCLAQGFRPILEVRSTKYVGNMITCNATDGEYYFKVMLAGNCFQSEVDRQRFAIGMLIRCNHYMLQGGGNKRFFGITKIEVLSRLPEALKKPDNQLQKFVPVGFEDVGMSQVASQVPPAAAHFQQQQQQQQQQQYQQPPPQYQQYQQQEHHQQVGYTTPEKRTFASAAPDRATPPPLTNAGQSGFGGFSSSSAAAAAAPAPFGCAVVDEEPETQPGYDAAPQPPEHSLPPRQLGYGGAPAAQAAAAMPAQNPYSQLAPPRADANPYQRATAPAPAAPAAAAPAPAQPASLTGPWGGAPVAQQQAVHHQLMHQPPQQQPPQQQPPAQPAAAAPQASGASIANYLMTRGTGGATAVGRATARVGGGAQAAAQAGFMPIRELSAYSGNRWRIKARIIARSDIRRFTNARGEGQLFKVDIKDESAEISATFFGKAVDMFFQMLKPNQVFIFQRGFVKAANPRFDKGAFTLTFEESAIIEAVDDDNTISGVTYDFKPLRDIEQLSINTLLDIRAVIYAANDPITFNAKSSGREMTKREIGLWDPSGEGDSCCVDLTLWGDRALGSFVTGSVIFLKDARVGEWQNTKVVSSPISWEIDPDDPSAFQLKAQYEICQRTKPLMRPVGSGGGSSGGGMRQTLAELKQEDLQLGLMPPPGQPWDPNSRSVHRHFTVATITSVPNDRLPCYPACPEQVESMPRAGATQTQQDGAPSVRMCQKKAQEENGVWRCAAGHTCQQPSYRYIGRLTVMDYTDTCEVNTFDDVAKKLYGCDADEFRQHWEGEGGPEVVNQRVLWRKVSLKVRSSKEVWQDVERVRVNVEEAGAVDFRKEARVLLSEVRASLGLGTQ